VAIKVSDCINNFLPHVLNELNGNEPIIGDAVLKYVSVNTNTLNIRKQSNVNSNKVTDREPAKYGAVLRVFKIQNGWYKISSSKQHWVSGQLTKDVIKATVNTNSLNVRNQPISSGLKVGSVSLGEELFIYDEKNNWCKIGVEDKWVKKDYLTI
jgi:uncharacterized protein (DUF736 family)